MNIYKTKEVKTGLEKEFRSMTSINKEYPVITIYNLHYHFSKCKKSEVIIKGVLIIKETLN